MMKSPSPTGDRPDGSGQGNSRPAASFRGFCFTAAVRRAGQKKLCPHWQGAPSSEVGSEGSSGSNRPRSPLGQASRSRRWQVWWVQVLLQVLVQVQVLRVRLVLVRRLAVWFPPWCLRSWVGLLGYSS